MCVVFWGVFVAVCLLAALFLVLPMVGSCGFWRDVCDVLCFLAVLVLGMVVVLVFTV